MFGRTYYCGEITEKAIGETVVLKGWVQKRRDLGGLIFIDLRDRTGIVQVVFNPDVSKDALETAESIRSEYVLDITGKVVAREEATVNPNLKTGRIEIQAESVDVLSAAKTPPFAISDQAAEVSEDIRLKHRYLDLRRPEMFNSLKMRHNVTKAVRRFLDDNGFLDIETPVLTKSTPEGARDYLVPSRVHEGEFYALPQSPQIFKQLLMVSGFDRYYQIARCFRDEDLRADRQPEFTQIDIEMSFMSQEDIMKLSEEMMAHVMRETHGIEISLPLPRMSYEDAMNRYGSDKPDTRFGMLLTDVSEAVKDSDFKVFASAVANGGAVKAINVKGAAANYSRKDIDALGEFAANYGAKGLAWLKTEADGLKGPIAKFFAGEKQEALVQALDAADGDLLLFVADKLEVANDALGALRLKLGKELNLIDESLFNFLWVVDWPLLEYDAEEGRYYAAHHPFTMPVREDLKLIETNPQDMKAQAYDLVLNGYELGGGSIRIFEKDVQEKMFGLLGFSEEEAKEQFGFLLEAFDYGAPPHGGIALGLDRLVMLLSGRTNLRDTIAFPKTASASCLMTEAPSEVDNAQLDELHLEIKRKIRQ
ncbi:aspartate--tRNA ligase [Bacillus licheniformis]|uniref:Aspartate--tRNA ligase n=3 Tax=Bacillus TaxID=1386 RepID=SYD_BACLD|nr:MULTISPECIES: aspartate--tRNA ligase [Bacillus]Q65GR4.1 RecName: Full=Aspartate--tRNA ligase; AltName: Full=Aspartyl-tRNA synthetase; Short=AspRS [Bacillus licheniformis DSM 13 = ATCC 14580]MBJ7888892.1 aspartate--tRNA ligase [Bacillaceae bacterium HSR45]MBY8347394.1 aspartate--tRNA ligase [Bacillus sp. PCH94]MDP4082016.1 aspartate--tRNA ligase [Bacillota bacterium]AAU24387.1 aspartyl-tRNA synthetase [Bacillus licheniformis DSM 13 = ATCC 14580]AAU41750.1 aspartyl-tRNA ligase AspS [Bacillus